VVNVVDDDINTVGDEGVLSDHAWLETRSIVCFEIEVRLLNGNKDFSLV